LTIVVAPATDAVNSMAEINSIMIGFLNILLFFSAAYSSVTKSVSSAGLLLRVKHPFQLTSLPYPD